MWRICHGLWAWAGAGALPLVVQPRACAATRHAPPRVGVGGWVKDHSLKKSLKTLAHKPTVVPIRARAARPIFRLRLAPRRAIYNVMKWATDAP